MTQVMAVGTAADKTAAVMGLMGGDAGAKACGGCLIPCSTAKDSTACAMACTQATATEAGAVASRLPPIST